MKLLLKNTKENYNKEEKQEEGNFNNNKFSCYKVEIYLSNL